MPAVQPQHGHPILELDSPSSSTGGALLTKVMPIHRPCPYPHATAARGMCWHSLSLRCFCFPVLRSWLSPQTTVWRREKAEEVFGDDQECAAAALEMWVCRYQVSVAASLLGCWVPRPARGETWLLPPGCLGGIGCSL